MLLPQKFEAIENLELLAKQLVDGFIIGLHKSPYHGFSVEFAEHRLYNQGDNLKHVDWKVFGRKDIMFTKKYEEETNLRCCIALDVSGSMYFPTTGINKLQHCCIAAAALITLFKKQLDAFSIATLSSKLEALSKFGTTTSHYKQQLATLQALANTTYTPKTTQLSDTIHELAERLHQRSLVILFTDVPAHEVENQNFLDSLLHLKYNKHEVLLFHLVDQKLETDFLYGNEPYEFEDMETGKTIKVFPNSIKEKYTHKLTQYKTTLANFCQQHQIGIVDYNLQEPITKILQEYLQKRSRLM